MADEIKTTSQPPACRNKKLCSTFVCKGIQVEDGILKCFCVESDPIANCTKFGDADTVRSNFLVRLLAKSVAAPHCPWARTEQCKYKKHFHELQEKISASVTMCCQRECDQFFPKLSILSSHEQQQFTCFFKEEQKNSEIQVGSRKSSTRFNIEELKISADHPSATFSPHS